MTIARRTWEGLKYLDCELSVEYDFDPGEPAVFFGNNPTPGAAPCVTVTRAWMGNIEVPIETIPTEVVSDWEFQILEQVRYESDEPWEFDDDDQGGI